MKKFFRLTLSLAALFAAACSVDLDLEEAALQDDQAASEPEYNEPGVVVVKFTEEMAESFEDESSWENVVTRSSGLNNFAQVYGISSIERVFPDDERWVERQHREGMHLWYTVTFDKDAVTVTKATTEMESIPGVVMVEPSPKVKLSDADYFSDPYFGSQWHLDGSHDINVQEVWEYYTTGDPRVIVAVLDGGLSQTHVDLVDNLIPGGEGGSYNFCDNSYTITSVSHGTHVGGLVAAISNNEVGVAGVAGGNYAKGEAGTKLMSCQIFGDTSNASSTQIANAIMYAADNGALITQNSWSLSYSTEEDAKNATTPQYYIDAFDYFSKYAGCDNDGNQLPESLMKGGLSISSAGNDNWQYGHPQDYEPIVAVGSYNTSGAKSSFSNYGDWVDICAPGDNIYSTDLGNSYSQKSGTSMATPIVSGVAALVIAYQGGPGFTCDDLRDCLLNGGNPKKEPAQNVGPSVDALGAVLYGVQGPPADIESYEVSVSFNEVSFTWNVPPTDEGGDIPAYGALLCASPNKSSIDNIDPNNLTDDITSESVKTSFDPVGSEVTRTLTVPFGDTYYVTCIPCNYWNNFGNVPASQVVTIEENTAPEVTPSIPTDDIQVEPNGSVEVFFSVYDAEGHAITFSHGTGSIAERWVKESDYSYSLTINGEAKNSNGEYVSDGTYTTTFTATDEYDAATTVDITYTILPNQAPTIVGQIEDISFVYGDFSDYERQITVSDYFTDPEEEELTYSVENSNPSVVETLLGMVANPNGGSDARLYVTMKGPEGTSEITVTATDVRGLSSSMKFSATVAVAASDTGSVDVGDGSVLVYPNPVSDVLYVAIGKSQATNTKVTISSSTGRVVLEETKTASSSSPADINVSSLSPGNYDVKVKYDSTEVTRKIVKI